MTEKCFDANGCVAPKMGARITRLEDAGEIVLALWDGFELAPHHSADLAAINTAFDTLRATLNEEGL